MTFLSSFDSLLKEVYCSNNGSFLRADGTWFTPADSQPVAASLVEPEPTPEPEPEVVEPLVEDEAPILIEAPDPKPNYRITRRRRHIEEHLLALSREMPPRHE